MNERLKYYFDYAASCPPYPAAVHAAAAHAEAYVGNPSSAHPAGRAARQALENARDTFAAACGFTEGQLVFTSGGTEANNFIVCGFNRTHPRSRLLLAADAHESAWCAARQWGDRVDILPVGENGCIDPAELEERISEHTVLCSVVHANNETGVVQDIEQLGRLCSKLGVHLHCDGAQFLGHKVLRGSDLPVACYTFSAHKFGGLTGVGGAFLQRGASVDPLIQGGPQESRLRSGTENSPGIAAAAVALEKAHETMDEVETEFMLAGGGHFAVIQGHVKKILKHLPGSMGVGI